MDGKELNKNLTKLLTHLDSIKDTLPMTTLLLEPHKKKAKAKFEEFLEKNAEKILEGDGNNTSISIKYENVKIFEQLSKNAEISGIAMKIIPESLFVSLISQYDAFLNKLLKILFKIRPEYINTSERELTFSQLIEFESIESAREYVTEKEVENVLRKSHTEHFEYLESKLAITLRKELPIWQTFIEITERRNLFVHCDGIVSNQYLKVCKEHKCNLNKIVLNQRLEVDPTYFQKAYECLYELATKLTHTIWRKLVKNDLEEADEKLNSICYSLLTSGQYELAEILLDFACKQNKYFNDSSRNFFVVNKALSPFLNGKIDTAKEIINSKDWSASSDNFKLAHLIITENFEEVYILMKKIGENGEVLKVHYKTWPLFYKLRKEQKFKEVFKEIFNEEYTVLEIPKRPVQQLVEEIVEKKPELKQRTVKKVIEKKQDLKKTVSKMKITTKTDTIKKINPDNQKTNNIKIPKINKPLNETQRTVEKSKSILAKPLEVINIETLKTDE